jgi:hypothetical protein
MKNVYLSTTQATLMRMATVLILPLQIVFPGFSLKSIFSLSYEMQLAGSTGSYSRNLARMFFITLMKYNFLELK